MVGGFYGHRMNLYQNTTPHEGFNILRTLGEKSEFGYFCFTSNVDGHFQKSGVPEDKVIECHGSINHVQCMFKGCHRIPIDGILPSKDAGEVKINDKTMRALDPLVC